MRVVALHRAARVSGVSSAGSAAAGMKRPRDAWRPLIVGEALTRAEVEGSALAGAPGLEWCTWPAGADAVEQVLCVREKLRSMGAEVVVPNDLPHGFVAAGLDHWRGLRCAAWLHSASHDGEGLVTSCFELAHAWRAASHEGRRRALAVAEELGLNIAPARAIAPAFVEVGPEFEDFEAASGEASGVGLLYAARLEKYHKRVLDLVTLADELASSGVRFRLTIAGDGPAAAELRAAMAGDVNAGRVRFVGAVSSSGMRGLLRRHHLLVLVSESEAAPVCVMEAMAAGRGVAVTLGCGEAVRWVRDGVDGFVVPTGDMAGLAERIAASAKHASLWEAMGRHALERARELFSEEARGPALQALVNEAAASESGPVNAAAVRRHWERILHGLGAIGPVSPARAAWLAQQWTRELNTPGVAATELPVEVVPRPSPAERRLQRVITGLRREGGSRFALYGAGRHTQKLERAIRQMPDIAAIVDDAAGRAGGAPATIAGRPVVSPGQFALLGVDALIISSDEHEREMMVRAGNFAGRVVPLYTDHTEAMGAPPRSVGVQPVNMHAA